MQSGRAALTQRVTLLEALELRFLRKRACTMLFFVQLLKTRTSRNLTVSFKRLTKTVKRSIKQPAEAGTVRCIFQDSNNTPSEKNSSMKLPVMWETRMQATETQQLKHSDQNTGTETQVSRCTNYHFQQIFMLHLSLRKYPNLPKLSVHIETCHLIALCKTCQISAKYIYSE